MRQTGPLQTCVHLAQLRGAARCSPVCPDRPIGHRGTPGRTPSDLLVDVARGPVAVATGERSCTGRRTDRSRAADVGGTVAGCRDGQAQHPGHRRRRPGRLAQARPAPPRALPHRRTPASAPRFSRMPCARRPRPRSPTTSRRRSTPTHVDLRVASHLGSGGIWVRPTTSRWPGCSATWPGGTRSPRCPARSARSSSRSTPRTTAGSARSGPRCSPATPARSCTTRCSTPPASCRRCGSRAPSRTRCRVSAGTSTCGWHPRWPTPGSPPRSRPAGRSYDSEAPSFTVLADPDGNKVCVCTFLGRA